MATDQITIHIESCLVAMAKDANARADATRKECERLREELNKIYPYVNIKDLIDGLEHTTTFLGKPFSFWLNLQVTNLQLQVERDAARKMTEQFISEVHGPMQTEVTRLQRENETLLRSITTNS